MKTVHPHKPGQLLRGLLPPVARSCIHGVDLMAASCFPCIADDINARLGADVVEATFTAPDEQHAEQHELHE